MLKKVLVLGLVTTLSFTIVTAKDSTSKSTQPMNSTTQLVNPSIDQSLDNIPFGQEPNGKDIIFTDEDGKLLLKGIVGEKHFGDDGQGTAYWTLEGTKMRVYIENNSSKRISIYISRLPGGGYGGFTYMPFYVYGNSSVTKTYDDAIPGRFKMYVENEDGSNLDANLRVRDFIDK